ncbi:hypothetical protein MLD38_004015 [Melastoma candidum]|nr:hypothetical protein MLD38_004015 [Melastoma candidum]
MLYHVVPAYLPQSQFQTVSNPLITKAGGAGLGEFPLNVTMYPDKVVVSTGVNNAIIEKTLFSDGTLVVYQVNKVLLPLNLFAQGKSYAQAPVAEATDKPDGTTATALASSAERKYFSGELRSAIVGVAALVVSSYL